MEKKPLFDVVLQMMDTHTHRIAQARGQKDLESHGFVVVIMVQLLTESQLSEGDRRRVVSKLEELLQLSLDRATSEGLTGALLAFQQD